MDNDVTQARGSAYLGARLITDCFAFIYFILFCFSSPEKEKLLPTENSTHLLFIFITGPVSVQKFYFFFKRGN